MCIVWVSLRFRILLASMLALILLVLTHPAWAWSNGHYITDLNNPDYGYGTHDWIAERALDWLPQNEKALILTYRAWYLYGTELPDNHNAIAGDGIGDQTCCHHVYFFKNQTLQDGVEATRASAMGTLASEALSRHDYANASKWTGAMSHYISDLASFGHVLGVVTEWGAEPESVHRNYEDHVQTLTDVPGEAVISVSFDGMLSPTSAYDAALALARDTTFDLSGHGRTAVWMNQTNSWSNRDFTDRAYQSIDLAVNYVAEAVHAVWSGVSRTIPVSSIGTDVVNAPAGSVIYVLPDWQTGSGHTKPPDVGTAALSDFTALGFMYGASTNAQIMALDTNSTYFNPATGAPKMSNSVLVAFAGPLVNGLVKYYEVNGTSPVYFQWATIDGASYYAWYDRQSNMVASLPSSAGQAGTSDMFLVEYFKDANNNKVFIVYGFAWKGTYVGGVLFKTHVLPNLAGFTHGWYIFRWDDANGNGLPDPYEVNTTPVNFGD